MGRFSDRINVALANAGMQTRNELADFLDVSRQYLSQVINGKSPGYDLWPKIAEKLSAPVDWIRHGTGAPPPWATSEAEEPASRAPYINLESPRQLPVIAYVGASSDGQRGVVLEHPETMTLSDQLAVVEVRGSSAYPVLYDGQKAIVHLVRPVRPNNLAMVVLLNNDDCLIKRWCPQHNDQIVLASPDGGRDSIVLHRTAIRHVWPVVGVLFE